MMILYYKKGRWFYIQYDYYVSVFLLFPALPKQNQRIQERVQSVSLSISLQLSVFTHPYLCQTLFTQYFLQFFANRFQILRYGDHRDLELINFE